MKKFLSLVLALVMTFSLVTISAGAKDFTDDETITYDEAVAVISEIGVVDGYTDGSFKPTAALTRGAAAKIICNLILGPTTAAELSADTAPYSDVPANSTFAGYIAYCQKTGIISGYADGTFRPSASLTGYAFMKMLLGALGYDQYTEGYTGANWSINVAKQALGIGLNAGLVDEFVGTKAVNREEAALYAFNTLQADLVDYDTKITANVNGAEVTIGNSNATAKKWGTSATRIDHIKDDQYIQFAEQYFPKLVKSPDTDDFERPAHTWVNNKTEIGTFVDWTLLVEEYTTGITGKTLYELLGKSTIADNYVFYYVDGRTNSTIQATNMIKTNSKTYSTTGNGVLTQVFFDKDAEEITVVSINTYLAEATADYNEKKETLSVSIYANHAAGQPGNDTAVTLDEVAGIEDYKNEDRFLVNVAWNGSKYEIVDVFDVEVLTDSKLTKYSTDSYVVNDGTQYDYALTGKLNDGGTPKAYYSLNEIDPYNHTALTKKTYNLYLDQYGYLIGLAIYSGEDNYVFIAGYNYSTSHLATATATANAIFLDGTMQNIQVDVTDTQTNINTYNTNKGLANTDAAFYFAFNDDTNTTEKSEYNRWFTYTTETKNGGEVYTLTPVDNWLNVVEAADTNINSYKVRLNQSVGVSSVGSTRAYGNDDSVYITVEAGSVSAGDSKKGITKVLASYTGVQEVDLTVKSAATNGLAGITRSTSSDPSVFAVYDDDLYVIGAIVVGEDTTSSKNYAYVLKDAKNEYIDSDDNYYWDFEAVVDGHITTLTIKTTASKFTTLQSLIKANLATNAPTAANGLMKLTYDKDGYVTGAVSMIDSTDKIYGNTDFGNDTDPDQFNAYTVEWKVISPASFTVIGRTLYGYANDAGLTLAAGAPVIVVQTEHYTGGEANAVVYDEYSTIDQALNSLANKNSFVGWVSAVLNDRGTAEYIVINSGTAVTVDTTGGDGKIPPTSVTAFTSVAYTDTDGTPNTGDEKITFNLVGAGAGDTNEVTVSLVNGGALVPITTATITGNSGTINASLSSGVYQLACGNVTYILGVA